MFKVAMPPEAEKFKEEVKAWLANHPDPTAQQLAKAGYVAPHWPKPWGRNASPIEQIAIDEVFKEARVRRPQN
ncbi:MAG: acyl-CoA dehydrogenase family protein, partial [Acidimicrobiia bacterium]